MKKIIFLFLLFCMVTNGYAQVDYNTIIESVKELSFCASFLRKGN